MTAAKPRRRAPSPPLAPLRLLSLEPGDESDPAWPCVRARFDAGGATLAFIITLVDAYAIDLKLAQALSEIHRRRVVRRKGED